MRCRTCGTERRILDKLDPKNKNQCTACFEKEHPPVKAPYEAPAVVSEETFETLALTCGKSDPGSSMCAPNPKS
jgi:hypothetical protein